MKEMGYCTHITQAIVILRIYSLIIHIFMQDTKHIYKALKRLM